MTTPTPPAPTKARLAPLLALLLIYALVLGAIMLGFRGTERSVGVSLRRAEEGIRASRALSLSLPPSPALAVDDAAAPAPLLPPLDAALQTGGLGEGARPGWEDAEAGLGEPAEGGMGYGDGDFAETLTDAFSAAPAPAPAPRRRSPSLLDGLDAALELPSVRRVPPREAAQAQWARQQARREEALEWVRERARADAAAEAARRASGTPSRASRAPPAPTPRAFTPEARLMLPDSFSAPAAAAAGPARTAKTIYPSEDATYGAAEFDVVSSPQQRHEGPEAARFSMTPEERILAAHVRGGGG